MKININEWVNANDCLPEEQWSEFKNSKGLPECYSEEVLVAYKAYPAAPVKLGVTRVKNHQWENKNIDIIAWTKLKHDYSDDFASFIEKGENK